MPPADRRHDLRRRPTVLALRIAQGTRDLGAHEADLRLVHESVLDGVFELDTREVPQMRRSVGHFAKNHEQVAAEVGVVLRSLLEHAQRLQVCGMIAHVDACCEQPTDLIELGLVWLPRAHGAAQRAVDSGLGVPCGASLFQSAGAGCHAREGAEERGE